MPFENLVFRPQSRGGQIPQPQPQPAAAAGLWLWLWLWLSGTVLYLRILDFQTPPAAPDELSNPDQGPSQCTQG